MAMSKAQKLNSKPKTVELEGVDENGDETTIEWKVRPLEGEEVMALEDFDDDEDKERIKHLLYHALKEDDPHLKKDHVLQLDFNHMQELLEAVGDVMGFEEDFFDEETLKEAMQEER